MARLQHVSTPYPHGRTDELRAFYGRVLGLEEKAVPESLAGRGLVWFSAGEGERELHFLPEDEVDRRSARHFCLEVDDVEASRRAIAEAGYETLETTPIRNRPLLLPRPVRKPRRGDDHPRRLRRMSADARLRRRHAL